MLIDNSESTDLHSLFEQLNPKLKWKLTCSCFPNCLAKNAVVCCKKPAGILSLGKLVYTAKVGILAYTFNDAMLLYATCIIEFKQYII